MIVRDPVDVSEKVIPFKSHREMNVSASLRRLLLILKVGQSGQQMGPDPANLVVSACPRQCVDRACEALHLFRTSPSNRLNQKHLRLRGQGLEPGLVLMLTGVDSPTRWAVANSPSTQCNCLSSWTAGATIAQFVPKPCLVPVDTLTPTTQFDADVGDGESKLHYSQ